MEITIEHLPVFLAALLVLFSVAGFLRERSLRLATEDRFRVVLDADAEAASIVTVAKRQAYQLVSEATHKKAQVAAQTAELVAEADRIVDGLKSKAAKELSNINREAQTVRTTVDTLQSEYAEKRLTFDRLIKEVAIFDDKIAFAEMGVYEPHFDFTDSEEFKAAIVAVRDEQKKLIADGDAVVCSAQWSVDGSRSKGKTMTNRNIKLTLRAFNGECDAAIANTRWSNAVAMEKRIYRAKEQIDRLNESNKVEVTEKFFALKLRELRLTHECREKLNHEREERAEAARLAREEQRLLRDLENAQKDEEHYAKLLEKARAEAASVAGPKLEAFADQIKMLERDLTAARAKAERAQALAERTSSGYIYIISNIGSFGENVIKIGLTRRLDPMDRIRELGDASVPFSFDVHAIIYSDSAPALERALHNEFGASRINAQNLRKEFFKLSLDDVENAVKKIAPGAHFFRDVEAQEYRETVAIRQAALTPVGAVPLSELPIAV